ncbi:MAG: hypothetical protein IIB02_08325 [Thaumarchaeota archaeon]|nr:hypothetical protein [Nitrososphaerota archaeon]
MLCDNCKIPMDDVGYLESQTKDGKKESTSIQWKCPKCKKQKLTQYDRFNK